MALLFGGISFPLDAQPTGASVVAVADPFLARALPYWQACLNYYIEDAYVAAMGAKASGGTSRACRTTLAVDPIPWLDTQVIETPLLACFPTKGPAKGLTLERDRIDFAYRVIYCLPSMDWSTYQKVAPILQAAYALLIKVTEQQHDDAYNSGERVWDEAGTMMLHFDNAEFGALDSPRVQGHFMPAFTAEMLVAIRDEYDPTEGTTLGGQTVSVGEGDADEGILDDAVVGFSEVG